MPALNFKARFADAVWNGEKRQTFRALSRREFKPGCTLSLYTGMRSPRCESLGLVTCKWVMSVTIYPDAELIVTHVPLDDGSYVGLEMGDKETAAITRADGFETPGEFFAFISGAYGGQVEGQFIGW
jgi:hypothetical protein